MTSRIYSITSVDLSLIKTNPPGLLVTAAGMVTTTGWTKPELVPFVYIQPPADGILDCDFVATPPASGQIVLQVLTPVTGVLALPDIDLENYWAPGLPLVGIRAHSAGNTKTALVDESRPGMPPMRIVADRAELAVPSFEADIKNLFRPRDVNVMKRRGGFDLHAYDDVVEWAERILERLESNNPSLLMPCDGKWPQTDIELFRAWIANGTPA